MVKLDISFRFKENSEYFIKETPIHCIQIKKLSKDKDAKRIFYFGTHMIYPDNMLLLGINLEHNVYVCILYKEVKGKKTATFTFDYSKNKYKEYMFTDFKAFWEYVIKNLHTTLGVKSITKLLKTEQQQEYYMSSRVNSICIKYGIEYRKHNTSGDSIDYFINNCPIQAKHIQKETNPFYVFTIHHRLQHKCIPYNENDEFEYLMLECSGTENDQI